MYLHHQHARRRIRICSDALFSFSAIRGQEFENWKEKKDLNCNFHTTFDSSDNTTAQYDTRYHRTFRIIYNHLTLSAVAKP